MPRNFIAFTHELTEAEASAGILSIDDDLALPAYRPTGPGDPGDWPVIAATEEGDYWDRFDGPAVSSWPRWPPAVMTPAGSAAPAGRGARSGLAAVHARLGFRLPADYREFTGAHGPVMFAPYQHA